MWNWNQQDVQPCNLHFSASSGVKVPLTDESTVLQIFQQFVTSDVLDVITRKTNLYNTQHPDPTTSSSHNISFYDTTSEELKVFSAVSIMMGIVRKPELHLYWSKDGLLETLFFSKLYHGKDISNFCQSYTSTIMN